MKKFSVGRPLVNWSANWFPVSMNSIHQLLNTTNENVHYYARGQFGYCTKQDEPPTNGYIFQRFSQGWAPRGWVPFGGHISFNLVVLSTDAIWSSWQKFTWIHLLNVIPKNSLMEPWSHKVKVWVALLVCKPRDWNRQFSVFNIISTKIVLSTYTTHIIRRLRNKYN